MFSPLRPSDFYLWKTQRQDTKGVSHLEFPPSTAVSESRFQMCRNFLVKLQLKTSFTVILLRGTAPPSHFRGGMRSPAGPRCPFLGKVLLLSLLVLPEGLQLEGPPGTERENIPSDPEGLHIPDCGASELPPAMPDLGVLKPGQSLKERNSQVREVGSRNTVVQTNRWSHLLTWPSSGLILTTTLCGRRYLDTGRRVGGPFQERGGGPACFVHMK